MTTEEAASSTPRNAQDIAGKSHWDAVWNDGEIPTAADPAHNGLGNLYIRRMDAFFGQIFGTGARGRSMLELGCGGSIWLPYFARRFGMNVSGIDYSESGCAREDEILRRSVVEGRIVCGDFFSPPTELLNSFDYAYSGGVAEHFRPTEACIAAFAAFLKPGGTLITMVPNMTGLVGWLQKRLDKSVYDLHVPLTAEALVSAHEKAGLEILHCGYFLSSGFGIVNASSSAGSRTSSKLKQRFIKALGRMSVITWLVEDWSQKLPATKLFSPQVYCVARKYVGSGK